MGRSVLALRACKKSIFSWSCFHDRIALSWLWVICMILKWRIWIILIITHLNDPDNDVYAWSYFYDLLWVIWIWHICMILIMTYLHIFDNNLFSWSLLWLICVILIMTYLHDPDYHLFAWSWLWLICMILIITYLNDPDYHLFAWSGFWLICMILITMYMTRLWVWQSILWINWFCTYRPDIYCITTKWQNQFMTKLRVHRHEFG